MKSVQSPINEGNERLNKICLKATIGVNDGTKWSKPYGLDEIANSKLIIDKFDDFHMGGVKYNLAELPYLEVKAGCFQFDGKGKFSYRMMESDGSGKKEAEFIEKPKTFRELLQNSLGELVRPVEEKKIKLWSELKTGMFVSLGKERDFLLEEFDEANIKPYLDSSGSAKHVEKPQKKEQIEDFYLPTHTGVPLQRPLEEDYESVVDEILEAIDHG